MIFASTLEIRVTREELRGLVYPKADEKNIAILQRMNEVLYGSASNYCTDLYKMLNSYFPQVLPRPGFAFFVDEGFCMNASDSLMLMFQRYPKHVAELAVRVRANETHVGLEVEDNGTGIDPAVEHRLFIEEIRSKKRGKLKDVYHGGQGIHLYEAKKIIDDLGGRIGHINKGKNRGALFWYEVPLENLLIKP